MGMPLIQMLILLVVIGGICGVIYILMKSRNLYLLMCVAAVVCFGGLAAVIHGSVPQSKPPIAIMIGVVVGGIGLAMLLRFLGQLIAVEINNGKGGPEGPG